MQLKYRCSNKERNWIMVVYVKMNKCTIVIHSVGLGSMQCPGRVLCIIRENPSVLESNHLHVVIFHLFLDSLRYIPNIPLIRSVVFP